MTKEQFNQLVNDYDHLENRVGELDDLLARYPYSQPLRLLNLKGHYQAHDKKYQLYLTQAAFYSTDRGILRTLIEQGKVPDDLPTAAKKSKAPPAKAPQPAPTQPAKGKDDKQDIDRLRQEVLQNLEELQKAKAAFWNMEEVPALPDPEPARPKTNTTANRKQQATPAKQAATAKKTTSGSKKSTKKKEELIDKFIAEQPTITPRKDLPKDQRDLAQSSSQLRDDLVSENLAVIYARQGKTAKAIEIYKKLIWKFPQKKASFAAKIEELENKQTK
ncbi:MAG TPA: hypothetical protein ENJ39_07415 [Flammeovirgaceae bacterium]|nr:hypothetical protein [Flammeovirgaceae bacterium]